MKYSNIKSKLLINKFPSDIAENWDPWKSGYICIPLVPSNGFIVNTENGQYDLSQIDVNYNTWKEIVAYGNGDIQVVWDGAVDGENVKKDFILNDSNILTGFNCGTRLTYKPGKYFFGFNASNSEGFEVKDDPSYNGFNTIIQNESFELLVPASCVNGVDFSLFRFYAFPEISKKLFYISNVTINRDPNDNTKILSYELSFEHIGNKLQKSGKAIEEYVHLSPIGMGYPWPYIDRNSKTVEVDRELLKLNGVVYCTEEIYNACIQNSSCFYGYEVVDNDNGDGYVGAISQPKDNGDGTFSHEIWNPTTIFPANFQDAPSNIMNKKAMPDCDFDYIYDIVFSENKWTDWKSLRENQITKDFDSKYDGEINYKLDLNADNSKKVAITCIEDLNDTKDYNYKQDYVANSYIKQPVVEPGKEHNTITLTDAVDWSTINFFNSYVFSDIVSIPFTFIQHVSYLMKDWAYVGTIFNFLAGGIPHGWSSEYREIGTPTYDKDGNITKIDHKGKSFNGLINTAFLNSINKDWTQNKATNKDAFLSNFFADSSADHFNANNRTMVMKYELTNALNCNISSPSSENDIVNITRIPTNTLGQQYYPWDGNNTILSIPEIKVIDGKEYYQLYNNDATGIPGAILIDNTFSPYVDNDVSVNKKKYVIVGYMNKNFAGQSIKLSFADENSVKKWQGAFDTECNFRNNSRDWTNMFIFNWINALDLGNQKTDWPIDPGNEEELTGEWDVLFNQETVIDTLHKNYADPLYEPAWTDYHVMYFPQSVTPDAKTIGWHNYYRSLWMPIKDETYTQFTNNNPNTYLASTARVYNDTESFGTGWFQCGGSINLFFMGKECKVNETIKQYKYFDKINFDDTEDELKTLRDELIKPENVLSITLEANMDTSGKKQPIPLKYIFDASNVKEIENNSFIIHAVMEHKELDPTILDAKNINYETGYYSTDYLSQNYTYTMTWSKSQMGSEMRQVNVISRQELLSKVGTQFELDNTTYKNFTQPTYVNILVKWEYNDLENNTVYFSFSLLNDNDGFIDPMLSFYSLTGSWTHHIGGCSVEGNTFMYNNTNNNKPWNFNLRIKSFSKEINSGQK